MRLLIGWINRSKFRVRKKNTFQLFYIFTLFSCHLKSSPKKCSKIFKTMNFFYCNWTNQNIRSDSINSTKIKDHLLWFFCIQNQMVSGAPGSKMLNHIKRKIVRLKVVQKTNNCQIIRVFKNLNLRVVSANGISINWKQ